MVVFWVEAIFEGHILHDDLALSIRNLASRCRFQVQIDNSYGIMIPYF